jgi:hypothetical protein
MIEGQFNGDAVRSMRYMNTAGCDGSVSPRMKSLAFLLVEIWDFKVWVQCGAK